MTYYGAKQLAAAFRTVRQNTIMIAEEIPEDKYSFSPAPGSRTVAQTLVHVANVPKAPLHIHGVLKLTGFEGFDFMALFGPIMAAEQNPGSKDVILAELRSEGEKFAGWLDGLSDEFLGEQVTQAPGQDPPTKSRFEMLLSVKEHEMHHRAQLMVVERMLGIVPHLTLRMNERIAAMQAAQAAKKG